MLKDYLNPINNFQLIGLENYFGILKDLLIKDKLPQVLMLTGKKGIGKFTLINHILHYYYDKSNYDEKQNKFINSSFNKQFKSNLFPNIIFLNSETDKVKIEDIRKLKTDLSKRPILDNKRFIILDNIETYNLNSLNALLRIIEEPGEQNYFILINNESQNLLETIKSRCLEMKVILTEKNRIEIISALVDVFKDEIFLDKDILKVSPGNFLKFNYFFNEKKLDISKSLISNFKIVLNLYKKEKNIFYKDFLLFFADYYLQINKSHSVNMNFIKTRSFLIKEINNFFLYNLNQNSLFNSIESRI